MLSFGCIPGHTGVLGTLPLTETTVATDPAGGSQGAGAGTRVHGDGLADDEAIVDELADGLTGVGVGDLVDLIGIQPDLALSATDNGRRKALLRAEIDPRAISISIRVYVGFQAPWEDVRKGGVSPRSRRSDKQRSDVVEPLESTGSVLAGRKCDSESQSLHCGRLWSGVDGVVVVEVRSRSMKMGRVLVGALAWKC
jgi:hypothetical protein